MGMNSFANIMTNHATNSFNKAICSKILQRRNQILMHSFIYYRMNTSIIPDYQFDNWAKELVQLQKDYPAESKFVKHYEDFKDFDSCSGYYLDLDASKYLKKAQWLIEEHGRLMNDQE